MNSFLVGSVAAIIGFLTIIAFFTLLKKIRFKQDDDKIISSSLSVPSPPTISSQIWKHHVFPSFHGSDLRRTFLSHILKSFISKGIDLFIDNHIERSKSIGPELIEAIRGSKIVIVLLSKNYASSSWCLDELVEIMKCREVLGQIVMTIFYEVDPTDIRKQTGDFGKAFRKSCKAKTKYHIERWRKALEDVAKIAGEHSHNWENEAGMIEKITTDVSNMLNISTPTRDFDGLVGMRAHMEELKPLLCLDLVEVRMIGIWGPPGIGKTTISRFLFNQISSRFQLGAIMDNMKGRYPRPCLDEYNAQLQLQNQMLSQIINQKDIVVYHLGVAQDRLKDKKVLLVLDEVDHSGQLFALAKEAGWFGPGSRIIITTEDLRILKAHKINHIYQVKFPSSSEAFEIFCTNAFGQKHPYDGFYELAWQVTKLAGELPLGLKVLGSALRGMSKKEWERALPRLKTRLEGQIESIIKFSYDALADEEKDLFLYIACLFFYHTTYQVEELLAKKFSDVSHSLQVLAEKSFISTDGYGQIEMHTLLEQFGRETSRKQYIHGLAKRQLLVDARELCDDTIDSRKFIGIRLEFSQSDEELNISEKTVERMSGLQFICISNQDSVAPCKRLQSVLHHSQKIRSLLWDHYQDVCLPSTFNTESLIELVMSGSKLQKLWEGTKPLQNLRSMHLIRCTNLKELPDLSTATNLKRLILDECPNLVELPSIENAIKLEELCLDNCSSLMKLPALINVMYLQKMQLTNCSRIVELPAIENATDLWIMHLCNCSNLVELPLSIGNTTNLQILDISRCSSLVKLSFSPGNITNLRELNMSDCSSLLELPSSIGTATSLETLNISGCSCLVKLPSSIGDISNLIVFNLSNCSSLLELPLSIGGATNIETLNISGCLSLVKLPSSIGDITNLRKFDLSYCSSLVELPSSINASNLQELCLINCSSVAELPAIKNANNLQQLFLNNCSSLMELPSCIGNATNLQELDISGCSSLVKFPSSIRDMANLKEFGVCNCTSLIELPPSIGTATNLQKLDISGCSCLMKLPSSIGDITNLRVFNLSNCSSLMELPYSIGNLQQLKELRLCGCLKLELLPTNINLKSLNTLDLKNCTQLNRFPEVSTNIEYLALDGTAITEVPLSIMTWSRLSDFHISYFESLKKYVHAYDIITELLVVNEDIQEVAPWVKEISCLNVLRLHGCNNLVSLPQLSDSLTYIDAENCKSLERLDCSFSNPEIRLNFINSFKLNQEARDLIMHTSTRWYAVLPGTQVPTCFDYRAMEVT